MLEYAIALLIFILPRHAIATISNEQVQLADYAAIRARDEGIDIKKFLALITCESNWDIRALGDYQSETDTYISRGILQFQKRTFVGYAKLYGLEGEWMNPYSQINLASQMISDGLGYHWKNCGLRVKMNK